MAEQNQNGARSVELELFQFQLDKLAEAMADIKASLEHMATKEQVAQLVSRREFDRLSWDLQRHKDDHSRQISELKIIIDGRSWRALLQNWALVVSVATSTIALYAVIVGWKP